jgi:hypothetical protein
VPRSSDAVDERGVHRIRAALQHREFIVSAWTRECEDVRVAASLDRVERDAVLVREPLDVWTSAKTPIDPVIVFGCAKTRCAAVEIQ